MRYLITLLGLVSLLGCSEPTTETEAVPQPAEHRISKSQEDTLQRAKDAAKALEQAGVRTESAIEKATSD